MSNSAGSTATASSAVAYKGLEADEFGPATTDHKKPQVAKVPWANLSHVEHVFPAEWDRDVLAIGDRHERADTNPKSTTAPAQLSMPTIEEIIRALDNPSTELNGARRLVLAAEMLPFGSREKPRALAALRRFIERYRDSNDVQDLVAVAAAIRKVVTNTAPDDLESIAPLLDAGHRTPVPLEIELEIAKAVVWNLTADPPRAANAFPQLAALLWDLVRTYLNDRLLPREKYAATALNAGLALLLMRSHVDDAINRVRRIRLAWFTELFIRRVKRVREDLSASKTTDGSVTAELERVCDSLQRKQ